MGEISGELFEGASAKGRAQLDQQRATQRFVHPGLGRRGGDFEHRHLRPAWPPTAAERADIASPAGWLGSCASWRTARRRGASSIPTTSDTSRPSSFDRLSEAARRTFSSGSRIARNNHGRAASAPLAPSTSAASERTCESESAIARCPSCSAASPVSESASSEARRRTARSGSLIAAVRCGPAWVGSSVSSALSAEIRTSGKLEDEQRVTTGAPSAFAK